MNVSFGDDRAGFAIRVEHHGEHRLVHIEPVGLWDRALADVFYRTSLDVAASLSGQRWSVIWRTERFPPQRPQVRASIAMAQRVSRRFGMTTAAVFQPGATRAVADGDAPLFASEHEAIAFALGLG